MGRLAALNLNIFARHADRVRLTNIAQMVNVLQSMILTDKEKMVLTPTYYIYRMYLPFQDAAFMPVGFDAGTYSQGDIKLPRIDAVAVRDTAGKLWLAVTNLDPARPARIELLTAPRVDSVNSFDAPDTVVPRPFAGKADKGGITLELPGKSVAVVRIDG
jgi:alpha-L-arabinofuranosidase